MYGIVFCRTRAETKEIASKLGRDGYNADALHGDLSQAQRDYVMSRFRVKQLQLLVATDVAARGIDVDDLTHIINYSLPDDSEVYLHRSGRTGRAGKQGISVIIVHTQQSRKIKELEKMIGKSFEYKEIPSGKVICEKRLYKLMDQVENVVVDEKEIESFLPAINSKLEWLSREELLMRFISVEFNQFLEYYRNAHDLNAKNAKSNRKKDPSAPDNGFSRFFINLGAKDNISAANLIGLINDNTQRRDLTIGKIDVQRNFSFFEVDANYEALILKSFKNVQDRDRKLIVELSRPDSKKGSRANGAPGGPGSFRGKKGKKKGAWQRS
jgi:ATP-dependent RNA helicase DeaD